MPRESTGLSVAGSAAPAKPRIPTPRLLQIKKYLHALVSLGGHTGHACHPTVIILVIKKSPKPYAPGIPACSKGGGHPGTTTTFRLFL